MQVHQQLQEVHAGAQTTANFLDFCEQIQLLFKKQLVTPVALNESVGVLLLGFYGTEEILSGPLDLRHWGTAGWKVIYL